MADGILIPRHRSIDSNRTLLVREIMNQFRPHVRDGRLVGLLAYARDDVPGTKSPSPLTLFRCGALTNGGKMSIDASLLKSKTVLEEIKLLNSDAAATTSGCHAKKLALYDGVYPVRRCHY
jgi:hypothetical protein